MYYVVIFKSRTNSIKYYDALNRERIEAHLINTPRAAGLGCGLSVKTFDLSAAKRVLACGEYSSFYGIFEAENKEGSVKLYDIT